MRQFQLSPDQFASLRSALVQQFACELTATTITNGKIELSYHYAAPNLTLSVTKKPFLLPTAIIWQRVADWIEENAHARPATYPADLTPPAA